MEENKINSSPISPKKSRKNNKEIIEVEIGRPNPAFNLISIKARYRFHQIKKNFSKNDYKNYMRKCKNMYSISSKMSSEMKMSEIYESEKQNINDILNIYHELYDKISSKRIRLTRVKKEKPILLKEKLSLSAINTNKEKQLSETKSKSIKDLKHGIVNLKYQTINMNKNINNNDNKFNTFFSDTLRGNFSNNMIKNRMRKKEFKKILNHSYKDGKMITNKNFENMENDVNNDIKKKNENSELINLKLKQTPLSCKSNGLTITNFGAIIYKNSIFRSKNISHFLHNGNQILPFIYSSKY